MWIVHEPAIAVVTLRRVAIILS